MAVRVSITIYAAGEAQGLVHYEIIPERRTVSKEMYIEILRLLRDTVRSNRPEKLLRNSWFILQDNAAAHRFWWAQSDGFGTSATFSELVTARLFLVSATKSVLKDNDS
jgi:hypothetical protein